MKRYWLGSLRDHELLQGLQSLVTQDRKTTAELLAHLAEVERRRLYAPAGYPSMFTYCVRAHGMSEDVAFKRIRVSRAARRFPTILEHIADGRLGLSGAMLLVPHLTHANATELIEAAQGKSNREIQSLLAERFPQPERPTLVMSIEPVPLSSPLTPAAAAPPGDPSCMARANPELAARPVVPCEAPAAAKSMGPLPPPARATATPLSSQRVAIQVTVDRATYAKLDEARALLGHAVPAGDLAQVLDRALDALVAQLRKRRCAQVTRPREARPRPTTNPRHIPAHVRRAVWARDGGRCTFVSDAGHRCEGTWGVEFDHVCPVGRGGEATVDNVRLRCGAHNQLEADRTYGAGFMREKRTATRPARPVLDAEVVPLLRSLGFRADEVRRGAAACAHLASASLDARLRVALASLTPAGRRTGRPVAPDPA